MLKGMSHTEQNDYYRRMSHISINKGKEARDCRKAELNKSKFSKGQQTSLKCRNRAKRQELKQGVVGAQQVHAQVLFLVQI